MDCKPRESQKLQPGRVRRARIWLLAAIIFITSLSTFAGSIDVTPSPRPDAPSVAGYNKKLFLSEVAAYTTMNMLDGISTVRDSHRRLEEARFPAGSYEMLGGFPSAGRYVAVMGGIEVATMFMSYKLEHTKHKSLRWLGHGLMISGASMHAHGAAKNFYGAVGIRPHR